MQPNATLFDSVRTFFFFPFSRHPTFIVTAVWQTVSKHQFHCVLQCVVNNTESSTDPQSANCDGGTSNSTAAATSVLKKPETTDWAHLCSTPHLYLYPSGCFTFLHVSHRNHDRMCIVYAGISQQHMHMQICWQHFSISTCRCQLQCRAQATNTHILPCVQCLFLHMTGAIVCNCMSTLSNVKRIVYLYRWVQYQWV